MTCMSTNRSLDDTVLFPGSDNNLTMFEEKNLPCSTIAMSSVDAASEIKQD